MDLEAARKALSKRSTFSSKRVAFFGLVGLCLVAGVLLRLGLFPQSEVEQNVTDLPSPPATATPAVEAAKSASQPAVKQDAPVTAAVPPPVAAIPAVEETEAIPQSSPPTNAVTEPAGQVGPTANAVGEPEPAGPADENAKPEDSGMILVARRPVEVLASPSSSAPALYGFPAGRPFRVVGRQGGFAHIQDLRSSASGWIDEAALAQPPAAAPASALARPPAAALASAPAQSRTFSTGGKSSQEDTTATANSQMATQPDRRRPGLFGGGGLFGGIFGNGN